MKGDFEDELGALMSEKARLQAPAALRLRVSAIPDKVAPSDDRLGLGATTRAIAVCSVVLVAAIVVASAWLRFGSVSGAATPSTLPTTAASTAPIPLTLDTEAEWSLPPSAGLICPQARYGPGPVRVAKTGSAMVFIPRVTGVEERLVWPHGYTGRVVDGIAQLLSPSDGAFYVCSIEIVQP